MSLSFPSRRICFTQTTMPYGFFMMHNSRDERPQLPDERIRSHRNCALCPAATEPLVGARRITPAFPLNLELKFLAALRLQRLRKTGGGRHRLCRQTRGIKVPVQQAIIQ